MTLGKPKTRNVPQLQHLSAYLNGSLREDPTGFAADARVQRATKLRDYLGWLRAEQRACEAAAAEANRRREDLERYARQLLVAIAKWGQDGKANGPQSDDVSRRGL